MQALWQPSMIGVSTVGQHTLTNWLVSQAFVIYHCHNRTLDCQVISSGHHPGNSSVHFAGEGTIRGVGDTHTCWRTSHAINMQHIIRWYGRGAPTKSDGTFPSDTNSLFGANSGIQETTSPPNLTQANCEWSSG